MKAKTKAFMAATAAPCFPYFSLSHSSRNQGIFDPAKPLHILVLVFSWVIHKKLC